jgi:hypothetical protein
MKNTLTACRADGLAAGSILENAERRLACRADWYGRQGDRAEGRADHVRAVYWYDRAGRCWDASHRLFCRRFRQDPQTLRALTFERVYRMREAAADLGAHAVYLTGYTRGQNIGEAIGTLRRVGRLCRAAGRLRLRLTAARGWEA